MYKYKAVDSGGKTVSGMIEAESQDQAGDRLGLKGLTPLSLKAKAGKSTKGRGQIVAGRVRDEELILYTTQLATMLRTGVPILRAVEILENEAENPRLKSVCAAMAADIRSGVPLHVALQRHPNVFSPLYRNMVTAGEASGTLPQVLQRLIYVISHEHKVRTEVRSVLQYPITVLVVLFVSMGILLTTVIPRFANVYKNAKITLPLPTRICIALSDFLRFQWPVLLIGLVVLVVGVMLVRRTVFGRYWMDRMILKIPYVGMLLKRAALSRFASIFSILQASGVGMLEAIEILSGTLGNQAMVREFKTVQEKVERGQGLSHPLAEARYFTPMFVSMVAIGEETGKLDEMLREISNHYDAEVEFATRRLTGAIGPVLIIILAAMVGFFAMAVYLPMWDIARLVTRVSG